MPRGRFPAVVLYITCAADRVDVNVHPAKTEVRFRDPGFVRGLIVSAIRRALQTQGIKSDTSASRASAQAFTVEAAAPRWVPPIVTAAAGFGETVQAALAMNMPLQNNSITHDVDSEPQHPLGTARAQLHGNYIVSQTANGFILVDQHAAHERIVYERLKRERLAQGIATQPLLVPQVVDLDATTLSNLLSVADLLLQAGLAVEGFGDGAVLVREVPAAIGNGNIPALLRDIADDAAELETIATLDARLNHVLATFACHHSVRSGRLLRIEEMNALLREMEVTPNAGQCNHGRPTFIELKMTDIERLFGR
jgi:DNA mismatch repair protein MutL